MDVLMQIVQFFVQGFTPENPTAAHVVFWASLVVGVARFVVGKLESNGIDVPDWIESILGFLDKPALNSAPKPKP